MLSPSSCTRCTRPLAPDSVQGLCETCRSAQETAGIHRDLSRDYLRRLELGSVTELPDHSAALAATRTAPAADFRAGLPPPPAGYDLLKRLGGGGMGDVYLAREHTTERPVAMKFLRSTSTSTAVDRFLAEVRALARIDHPHIVRVLATDFLRATPFYTMEYATGGTLSARVQENGPLPPREAARVMAIAARAIHAAHEASVLHRDLKPSNILLAADGSPKVADFGLAKLTDITDGPTLGTGPIGTPGFMPPEQIAKRYGTVGPAADVYGLGATLYHVLTGRPPFTGETPAEIVTKVENSLPDRPCTVRPDLPGALEAIVVKCLEKDPAARYPSAAALADDLDRFLAGATPKAPLLTPWHRAKRWASRNRVRIAAALAVVVVALTAAAVTLWPKPDPQDKLRAELKAGRPIRILGETGHPDWLKNNFLLHPAPLSNSTAAGGACAFESLHPSLLAFLKDPGIDSYKISGELRTMRSSLIEDMTKPPNLYEFARTGTGLFFGHVSAKGTDGTEAHGFMIAKFREYLPEELAKATKNRTWVEPKASMIVVRPNGELHYPDWGAGKPIRFDPAPTLPGDWRLIQAEVRPSGVKVFWAETPGAKPQLLAEWTADEINAHYAELQHWLRTVNPPADIVLPTWSPRSPFGIWSNSSAVAVRNVTVEPLK